MKKSSYILNIVLLLSFMTVSFTAKAQWQKWHFGAGVGSMTYYGDLSDKFVNANLQELGYHAYLERLIAKRSGIYLRVESVNGHLLGSDRAPKGWINGSGKYFDRALNFRTEIHDVNTSMVFYFGSNKKRERAPFLNAYVRAGIGVGYFDVYGDLKDADGNIYNYWTDGTVRSIAESAPNASNADIVSRDYNFETNLRELEIEKAYTRFKWQIPVGLGLKMRLADAVSLVLDAQYTYSMTDYLDNVGDKKTQSTITDPNVLYAADPTGYIGDRARNINSSSGINDSYLYVSAGLTFNVGDNSKPKFKTPVYYPKVILPIKDTSDLDYLTEAQADSFLATQKDKDTVLQKIIAPSSLSLKMRVDSVTLVKSLDDPNKYVVQYFIAVDSLELEDAQLLYKKDIIVLDTTQLPLIEDSIYTSAQTMLREVTDSLGNQNQEDTIMSSQDSILYMIHQLQSKLGELESAVVQSDTNLIKSRIKSDSIIVKSNAKDSLKNQISAKKDTSKAIVKVVNPEIDSIVHQQNIDTVSRIIVPKVDSLKTPSSKGKDSLSVKSQSLVKDSTKIKSKVAEAQDSTTAMKTSLTTSAMDTTAKRDSLENYDNQQAELKRQIEDLQNQLKSQKDSINSTNLKKAPSSQKDTLAKDNQKIEELKNELQSLDSTSVQQSDSLRNKQIDAIQLKATPKDSVVGSKAKKVANAEVDTLQNRDDEKAELKRQIEDLQNELKSQKDSVVTKPVQIDSSALKYNQEVEDLKKQIQALENTSKAKADSLQMKEEEISKLKSAPKDTTSKTIKPDTKAKKAANAEVDTLQNSDDENAELKRQIEDLQNELKSQKDSVGTKPVQIDSSALKDSQAKYNQEVDDLKKQIQALENTSKAKADSLQMKEDEISKLKSAPKDTTSKTIKPDTKAKKVANVEVDTLQNRDDEKAELKRQIEDLQNELKSQKDSVVTKPVQIDSSALKDSQAKYNQEVNDLKKQIQALEDNSKTKADSLQKQEAEISKLKSSPKDTTSKTSISNASSRKSVAPQDDTIQYYERQQEDLKRQIEDLQNELKSKNEPSNLRVSQKDTTSKAKATSAEDPSIQEMRQRIKDLENSSKSKSDSLKKYEEERKNAVEEKVESNRGNSKSSTKIAAQPIQDNSKDSLRLKIAELENQLYNAQRSNQDNSRRTTDPYYREDTINSNKKVNPNVTLAPNLTFGNSKKDRNTPAYSDREYEEDNSSPRSNKKDKKEKQGSSVGFDYNGKPGFFEAKRQKKEAGETLASDDTTLAVDSLSFTISSTGDTVYNYSDTSDVDSDVIESSEKAVDNDLIEQNENLRNQISNIQKNQDSLIAVLGKLIDKSNQPLEKPEPIVIEKEVRVPQEVDSSAIIESLLKQPSTKVFFAVGKSSVSSQYKMGLDQLANQVNTYPELKIRLKGFADPTGNAAANLKLSENRANAVKTYLIQSHNLTPDKIIVLPAGQEDNSSDMSYSRRVEVQLVK
ncbi:MAG TPA: OmpA family protein [Chitinophagales bacterium]|nr:OmpA family protein [Chitinophagales bacterium]